MNNSFFKILSQVNTTADLARHFNSWLQKCDQPDDNAFETLYRDFSMLLSNTEALLQQDDRLATVLADAKSVKRTLEIRVEVACLRLEKRLLRNEASTFEAAMLSARAPGSDPSIVKEACQSYELAVDEGNRSRGCLQDLIKNHVEGLHDLVMWHLKVLHTISGVDPHQMGMRNLFMQGLQHELIEWQDQIGFFLDDRTKARSAARYQRKRMPCLDQDVDDFGSAIGLAQKLISLQQDDLTALIKRFVLQMAQANRARQEAAERYWALTHR